MVIEDVDGIDKTIYDFLLICRITRIALPEPLSLIHISGARALGGRKLARVSEPDPGILRGPGGDNAGDTRPF